MTITTIRTDDPDTPFFNELLFELPGGEIVMHGGLKVPTVPMPDFLAEAFEIDPDDFVLLNGTHVPTVGEIEDDILAGRVALLDRHWGTVREGEDDPAFPADPPAEPEPTDDGNQPQGRHRSEQDDDEPEPEPQEAAAVDPGNRDS